jgi:hypothetical protein
MFEIPTFENAVKDALSRFDSRARDISIEQASYENEYEIFVSWFSQQDRAWTGDLVRLAGLAVYGWMPTILRAEGRNGIKRQVNFDEIATLMLQGEKDKIDLDFLNGSVVGTSKFLHFWRPDYFAIWDSRIRDRLRVSAHENQIECVGRYYRDMRLASKHMGKSLRQIELALFVDKPGAV